MKLSELLSEINPLSVSGSTEIEIAGLSEDSRNIKKGFLFFAREGQKSSGTSYISDAIMQGAAAVISEEKLSEISGTTVRVSSILDAESKIASRFYNFPSRDLTIVGVTGTNGKTTFSYLLENVTREMGWRVGVIGTVNYRIPDNNSPNSQIFPAPNTTPNALELNRLLSLLRERNTDLVVMEVSSHALTLGRVDSIEFDGAVFTNLTQDHLDFHKTMENYFLAKAKLFQMMIPLSKSLSHDVKKVSAEKFCIINSDDSYSKRMASFSRIPVKSYGLQNPSNVSAHEIHLSSAGSTFRLVCDSGNAQVRFRLIGLHNIYNAIACASAALQLGVPLEKIIRSLGVVETIPGRLEPVVCGQDFTVLVDYAHTDDALKNVLNSLKQLAKKKVLTLFGCGGDRDRSKRPLMGATAVTLSDWVILTSDNPRTEDPAQIALDIEVGIRRIGKKNYELILDREQAIKKILSIAEKDDIVLLAGKGHETYQIFSDRTIEFDDREIVRNILCSH